MIEPTELQTLFRDLEADRVERKPSLSQREEIRKNICAFSNDLPDHRRPGVIFIGVEDNGQCSNLPITDEMLRTLSDMRSDGNTLPPPVMTVQKHRIDDCELAVVTVAPSDSPPTRYKGVAWVRIGPQLRRASAEEERRLAEKRRAADLPFDSRPVPGATLHDLNLDNFRHEYLANAIAPEVLEENQRSIEQQLASLRFAGQDHTPVNGALLAFASDPQRWLPGAYIQFLRIDGEDLTDPVRDQKEISGPLRDQLSRLDELLEINISTSADLLSGPTEIKQPDYPIAALQQLARNAVMHRSYEGTNAPVRIYWFNDRIEISNPGGLYGQVNQDNFGQGATDYRNPLIAETMKVLGYVQRFGFGIPIARKQLEKNGNPPPEFQFRPESVLVTLRRTP